MEAHAVFQLGAGQADTGRHNPAPLDAAVGGLYASDFHSTIHVPAGMRVWILPLLHKVAGDAFKSRLGLDPEKAIHRGDKGSEVLTLI